MFLRVLILMLLIFLIPYTANANDSINDFEIEVLPAEGQQSFSEGYFHVDSKPGQTLSLDFRITNNGEETVNLLVDPVDAYTADTGGILYSTNTKEDEKDHIRMSEIIDMQESVSVAPGAVEIVHFHVVIPDSAHGTILGGVMLSSEDMASALSLEELNKGGSNYTFEQAGQRLIAVKLNLPEKSSSGFSLRDAEFDAVENLVKIKIKNGKSTVLENVQGTYTVMDKDGETVINGVLKPFAMAPVSEIHFPIDLKEKLFEKGKYVLMIKGRADGKEFLTEEKFTVTENQEAGIVNHSEEAKFFAGRENMSRTIAIALTVLFLLLPLLLKIDRKNGKKSFMDISDKNNI